MLVSNFSLKEKTDGMCSQALIVSNFVKILK